MLTPKKTKYRKYQKGRIGGIQSNGGELYFGQYGLISLSPARITARQIEACRVAISRKMKRIGKIWISVFPDIPVTAKPAEVRMGKGKGNIEYWMCRVKSGSVLFEISGVSPEIAKIALNAASSKLPVQTKYIEKVEKERRSI
jgi:large subunit ribosomal protein L16